MDYREYASRMDNGEFISEKRVEYRITPLGEGVFQEQIISDGVNVDCKKALHPLGCGHLVGSEGPQELSSICHQCGSSICWRPECHSLCDRCGILICACCRHKHNDTPYCRKCKNIAVAKQTLVTGLLGIHNILAKDINDE